MWQDCEPPTLYYNYMCKCPENPILSTRNIGSNDPNEIAHIVGVASYGEA